MKKINLSRSLLSVSLIFIFSLSCKKEQSTDSESLLQSAKKWYLKTNEKSTLALQSSGDKKESIKQELKWNNANVYTIEGVDDVVGVPMNVNLTNGRDAKGSYILFIAKVDNEFKSLVVYNEKEDYFEGTFTNTEIETIYKNALTATNIHKNKLKTTATHHGSSSVSLLPAEPPVCIDWYWTDTIYDYDGSIMFYNETYLYTTCTEGSQGGGTSTPPDFIPDFGNPVSIAVGNTPEIETVVGIDSFRVSNVDWIYHSGLQYHYKSTERMAVRTNGGNRVVYSIVHQGVEYTGNTNNYTVELLSTSFTPHTYQILNQATMTAKYKVKIETTAGSFISHYTSPFMDSYCSWNANFQKLLIE